MSSVLRYHKTADSPPAYLWLVDDSGTLIDFSAGYTFSLKIGNPGSTAILTKTSGITGAAGSGVEPSGTPNLRIAWTAGELALTPGPYQWQLTATDSSSLDRVFTGVFELLDVIT